MTFKDNTSAKLLFDQIVNRLAQIYNPFESRQLTKMLMAETLSISFEEIMIDQEVYIGAAKRELLEQQIELLMDYHPIQYVLGTAHFFDREFMVNPSVLIPRQETEELVKEILIDNKRPNLKILDIGSGSGCIGITLALELENAKVTSLDIDKEALAVTLKNAEQHGVHLESILKDILTMDELPEKYDIIVSNPPYVTEKEKNEMHNNVLDHEPHLALFVPDEDALKFYQKIVWLSKRHLNPNGKLYLEINENFGPEILTLCENEKCSFLKLVQDINGKDRIIKAMFDS
jgi:release factor glutamine methyltransferase